MRRVGDDMSPKPHPVFAFAGDKRVTRWFYKLVAEILNAPPCGVMFELP